MYNYHDLEAEYPRDKAVQKFLVADYFHDSKLNSVEYRQDKKQIMISLQCYRDWEDSNQGNINDEAYCYILRFSGVAGFRYNTGSGMSDYINGRFKKTAWLSDRQNKSKRTLYQFRIGLVDGFIDIVFHSFQVRKAIGRIGYQDITDLKKYYQELYRKTPEQLCTLQEELYSGSDPMMDDIRLEQLYANGVENLPSLCRLILTQNRDEDAKAYAAWLLGKYGNLSDKELIWQAYHEMTDHSTCEAGNKDSMVDRNYIDAIEHLMYKSN